MQKILPTWRNRRVGDAALARRLDRFLMKETLLQQLHHYKQWVGSGGWSDHTPIYLEIQGPFKKPKAPFKFNHTWLKDPSYVKMITDYWSSHPIDSSESLAKGFCRNLSEIKHISIVWAKEKQARDIAQLTHIEAEICSLTDERGLGFLTAADKCRLIELENQKAKILKEREESTRLRSRALWTQAGDANTKFFHSFSKSRKVTNTIWKLPTPDGQIADTFNKLAHLGTSHFRDLYKCPHEVNLPDIINVENHFPRFVEEDDVEDLNSLVSVEELEGVLKWFKKDKSPGPDGWTIEFYLAFFDVLGQDLMGVVEESRTTGSIYHAINSTFIALIPKFDTPKSFDDYRPISLCNCLYKIISKTIANRLRPILSRSITPQQFTFLKSRQIHEAIGLAQEAIHSIWSKHLKAILLKIDLSKAFDRVSWLYIKMILIHLGFPHAYISWIMACITSPTFSILINGSASPFFHSERGLRQGCPLSPLLFLLVMEGLSRLMESAKSSGDIRGLRISELCSLTHLLFVDDVLILLDGNVRDSRSFSKILKLFSAATGDWVWLVAKLEKRLTGWSYRFLSRAGRLVLIKSVLEATPVFWMALAWIPRNILGRLQQMCNRYLWNGNQEKRIFAWISWKKITLPKNWGGWGLKELPDFTMALAAKMGWTLLTSQNLWAQVSYHKYIWPLNIMDWARLPSWTSKGCSSIWKALIHSLPLIRDNLVWRINDGMLGRIGLDPWINSGGRHILNCDLIAHLHNRDIQHFAHIADHLCSNIFSQAWKTAQQLDLPPQWHQEWSEYILALSESHIRIKQGPDELIWCKADNGIYAPKFGYRTLISHRIPDPLPTWWNIIWKLNAPPGSRLFFWCALKGTVPTGEHLTRRAIYGPSWCTFCKAASETSNHIFLHCPAVHSLWNNIRTHLGRVGNWLGEDLTGAWTAWTHCHPDSKLLNLPLVATWFIWLARNRIIFEDQAVNWTRTEATIIAVYQEIPEPPPSRARTIQAPLLIDKSTLWAFFDGAANQAGCGGGFILHINEHHRYLVKMGLGRGSNNFVELSAIRNLLHFALTHQHTNLNIFGDSMMVVNWINNASICHTHTLNNLLYDALTLKAAFNHFSCLHIYREHNSEANKLSKEASILPRGKWLIVE
eukprot:PITA_20087